AGHVLRAAAGDAAAGGDERVVEDLVVRPGRVELDAVIDVVGEVVVDDVVGRPVVEVDGHAAEAPGRDVVDAVVGDLSTLTVGPEGVDAAAVGRMEHHVVHDV